MSIKTHNLFEESNSFNWLYSHNKHKICFSSEKLDCSAVLDGLLLCWLWELGWTSPTLSAIILVRWVSFFSPSITSSANITFLQLFTFIENTTEKNYTLCFVACTILALAAMALATQFKFSTTQEQHRPDEVGGLVMDTRMGMSHFCLYWKFYSWI